MKDRSYFLRKDIDTYKPKFVKICYPTKFLILRYGE